MQKKQLSVLVLIILCFLLGCNRETPKDESQQNYEDESNISKTNGEELVNINSELLGSTPFDIQIDKTALQTRKETETEVTIKTNLTDWGYTVSSEKGKISDINKNSFIYIAPKDERDDTIKIQLSDYENGISYSKYKPVVAVDPTLLLDSNDWASILPPTGAAPKSDYVLGFFIEGNFDHLHATKKFAKQKKMKYVFVPYSGLSYYQIGDRRADAGLEDLLELIRNARYVITDSFHITVFSIIHRKQFYSFMRYRENPVTSTNSRIRNLLHTAGLENRGLEFGTRKIKELPDIDYAPHMKMLQQEIEKSKEFLQKSIRGEYRGEV